MAQPTKYLSHKHESGPLAPIKQQQQINEQPQQQNNQTTTTKHKTTQWCASETSLPGNRDRRIHRAPWPAAQPN